MKKYHYDNFSTPPDLPKGSFFAGFQECLFYDDDRERKARTAIWYPTKTPAMPVLYRDTFPGIASPDAPFIQKKCPLIVMSHGSQGHRFNQHYLAEFMASHGYLVAAIEHQGDNSLDNTLSHSPENLALRSQDIPFLLNKLLTSHFKDALDNNRIGFSGHSFGACTGLMVGGAKLTEHTTEPQKASSQDNRIKCLFLMAPALSKKFSSTALKQINVPVALLVSLQDEFLKADTPHFLHYLTAAVEHIYFNQAGHYVYLMTCPKKIKEMRDPACLDIGSEREKIHPFLKFHMLDFFHRNLPHVK